MSTIDGLARSVPRYPEATNFYPTYRPGRSYRPGDVVMWNNSIYRATHATSAPPATTAFASGNVGNSTYWQTTGEAYAVSDTNVRLCTGNYQTNFVTTKETFTAPVNQLTISARFYGSGADHQWFGIRDASISATSETTTSIYGFRTDFYGTNNIYEIDNGGFGSTLNTTTAGTWTWTIYWDQISPTVNNMYIYRNGVVVANGWGQSIPSFTEYRIVCIGVTGGVNGPHNFYDRPGGETLTYGWETIGVGPSWR